MIVSPVFSHRMCFFVKSSVVDFLAGVVPCAV